MIARYRLRGFVLRQRGFVLRLRRFGLGFQLVAVLAVPVLVSGCRSEITSARLEPSVASTFARLLVLQQREVGLLPSAPEELDAHAGCRRTGDPGRSSGAGDDWQCQVSYAAASGPVVVRLDVRAKPDGCWTADGAPFDVGPATLDNPTTGATGPNPLAEFDGCLRRR